MVDAINLAPLVLLALSAACAGEREWWAAERLALLAAVFGVVALMAGPPPAAEAPSEAARLEWSARHAPGGW